ncbi:restriction endonuclease [Pedobacter gandavensis]|uniref:nSTAND3 domain-containing NTPase n=1 Tax=Pedobacter gandavensis TaxID=2679963 RepID=UPI00292E244A|nr:restriction endonuclease [Pedobacter gandavensis]
MKYNLDVLNDKEFEDLCKDLFDVQYQVDFQIFKAGKDGGIDLVFAGDVENEIVVQCKHYINSTYAGLLNKFKNTELANLGAMVPSPKKYVIATTLALSTANTRELKDSLAPYIRTTNDIYGRKRIENLIAKNKDIEKKFFKLWLTSTNVMLNILHHASIYNSDFHRAKIISKARLYVPTENFNKALDKLAEHKFLVISGAPGVGKSTLAFMLICERLAEGYNLVYCDGRISEVEQLLSDDPKLKQIFFIDDFLGANLYDLRNPKNPENKLISFIHKFQSAKNKYLVLTSRTTILNQAQFDFEHLKNSGLTKLSEYELELEQYSVLSKAQILYNHLFFSNLNTDFLASFFEKKVYSSIIQHQNYFPRLIQFITDESKFKESEFKSVKDYVLDKLDNPDEIWQYAYEKQLNDEDRFLLLCLFTLGGNQVNADHLSVAFEARYKYEIKHNNLRRQSKAFQNSTKKVLNGFVNLNHNPHNNKNQYSFFNPSVVDFLLGYLKNNDIEIISILSSAVYLEQFTIYFDVVKNNKVMLNPAIKNELFCSFISRMNEFQSIYLNTHLPSDILNVLHSFFDSEMISNQHHAISLIEQIVNDTFSLDAGEFSFLLWLIGSHEDWPQVIDFIKINFEVLACGILENIEEENDIKYFAEIFPLYGQDLRSFIQNNDNKLILQAKLAEVFADVISDIDHDEPHLIDFINEYGAARAETRIVEKVWNKYIEFIDDVKLSDYFKDLEHNYEFDSNRVISDLQEDYYDSRGDQSFSPRISQEIKSAEDPWIEIHRLFTKKQ